MTRVSSRLLLSCVLVVVTAVALTGCRDDDDGGPVIREMTPLRHARYFQIDEGPHAVDCTECHRPGSESFKQFDCLSCHEHEQEAMDATHNGFEDYAYNSPRCYACHGKGNLIDDVDHDAYFPIRADTAHEEVRCAECHTDPNNRERVGCTSCHEHEVAPMASIHDGMPDYNWASPACLTCHPQAEPVGLLDHGAFFPTAPDDKHGEVSCAECHLAQDNRKQLGCITCHEHERPEMDEEHDAVPDYLYDSGSCFLCHQQAQVPGALDHAPFFPITPDDTHGEVSCAECHTNPETRADIGCTTCHENHGQADMARVHTDIPGYLFESPSCVFCHPQGEPQGQIDHAPFFPITPDDTHGGLDCVACHTDRTDRAQVGCITCHEHDNGPMAQQHQGVPGYRWDSPSCLGCHPNGEEVGAVDHTFFPIDGGTAHGEVSCAECHVSDTDRAVVGCTSCHEHEATPMNGLHRGIPDYTWSSTACVSCHPSGQPQGRMDHTGLFPIALGDTHNEVSCAECHASQTDRQDLSCTTCHEAEPMGTAHTGVPEYLHASSSCVMCHRQAQVPGVIDHAGFFPIDPPAVHDDISCAECHTNPNDRQELGCTSCHEASPTATIHDGVPGYEHVSTTCLLCHPNAEPTGQIDHTSFFPIDTGAAHNPVACAECHTNPANKLELGCAQCHTGQNDVDAFHTGIPGFAHESPACLTCHPQADTPGFMDHDPFFPITPPDTHGVVSCAECHQNREDRAQLSCADCHTAAETNPIHSAVPGYTHDSPACLGCHPQGEPGAAAVDHTLYFPIAAGDTHNEVTCAECHINPNDVNDVGCADCHTAAETNPIHTAVPGYTHTSTGCLTCHPNGEATGLSAIDHEPIFPIAPGTDHFGVGCGECHLDGNDTSVNGCAECHSQQDDLNAIHTDATNNFSGQSPDCKLCHGDAQVHEVSTHGPFRINSGPHRRKCLECHLDNRADKPFARDFEVFECIECHEHRQSEMDDKHSEVNGYEWRSLTCVECHPTGRD